MNGHSNKSSRSELAKHQAFEKRLANHHVIDKRFGTAPNHREAIPYKYECKHTRASKRTHRVENENTVWKTNHSFQKQKHSFQKQKHSFQNTQSFLSKTKSLVSKTNHLFSK